MAELKSCQDTSPQDQLAKCLTQHAELIDLLHAASYTKENITVVPILIGHSGLIYVTHTLDSLTKLGLDKTQADKCACCSYKIP